MKTHALERVEVAYRPDPVPEKVPLTLVMPTWMLVLLIAAAFFFLAFALLNMSSKASQVQKSIHEFRAKLEHSQEINQSLEVQLSKAEAPDRIQSVAVNTLGMYQPLESEIIIIPRVEFSDRLEAVEPPPKEGGGIFRYLLDLFGI